MSRQPTPITPAEKIQLLNFLLHPNCVTLGSAIRRVKSAARIGLIDSPSSVYRLRKFCNDYRQANPEVWKTARGSEKQVKPRQRTKKQSCLKQQSVPFTPPLSVEEQGILSKLGII